MHQHLAVSGSDLRAAFLNVRIAEAVLAYEDKDDGQSQ